LLAKSVSGERIRTEQPNTRAGSAKRPISIPGWSQRHAPVNNVPFTHRNHYPPEPLAPLARPVARVFIC
jgi:hypothetical protein